MSALSALESVGGSLLVNVNEALVGIAGWTSLRSVGNDFLLVNLPVLEHIDGLSALETIGGELSLNSNPTLSNLDGLRSLTTVDQLFLFSQQALENLDGLSSLREIRDGGSSIISNGSLLNVDGLAVLEVVGGQFTIGSNPQLSECDCGFYPYISRGGDQIDVGNNAPGCNSLDEIMEPAPGQCNVTTSMTESELEAGYALSASYPNPALRVARFGLRVAKPQIVRVEVFDVLGWHVALLHDGAVAAGEAHAFEIDTARLPSRAYVYRATGEDFARTGRFVVSR